MSSSRLTAVAKPLSSGSSGKKSPIPTSPADPASRRPSPAAGRQQPLFVRSAAPRPKTPPVPRQQPSHRSLYSTSPPPPPASASASTLQLPGSAQSAPPNLDGLCNAVYDAYAAQDEQAFHEQLTAIRSAILFHGIPVSSSPPSAASTAAGATSLRGRLWQIFLGLGPISSASYIALISRGKCATYDKIRGDSFRTFPQDRQFTAAVREEQIVRCLNAFVHQHSAASASSRYAFTYCQGMNTIAAPMLFCMGELSAYHAFAHFVTRATPLYWLSSHIGAEAGCALVDRCLQSIDPELWAHLSSRQLSSYLYAFHCVSSFSASVPPFSQLLILWDFLLAFGPHLNILIVAAQIISLRQSLLASSQPKAILDYRKWPQLRARVVIAMSLSFISFLDKQLYDDVSRHAWDEQTAERITGRKVEVAAKD